MIRVSTKLKLNMARIKELNQAAVTALEQTAEALHTEVVQAQVMPRDTGTLQNEGTFVDLSESDKGTVSIVSSTPYARRLYFHPEYNFQKDENPNAKGLWFEDWAEPPDGNGSKSEWIRRTFKELYRRLAEL